MKYKKLTKSGSDTLNWRGLSLSSMTFVSTGAFSSTKPSVEDAEIFGGFWSTGLTNTINLAVANLLLGEFSSA